MRYDLLVLDLGLPGEDAGDFIQSLWCGSGQVALWGGP